MARPDTFRMLCLTILLLWLSPVMSAGDLWQDYARLIRQRQYSQAAQLIEPMASARDPQACYELAQLYRNGTGVNKDVAKARALLETAAHKGHADSQYLLGLFYRQGIGGSRDPQRAQHFLQQAAEQRHDKARKALAQSGAAATTNSLDAPQATSAALKGDLDSLRSVAGCRPCLDATDNDGNRLLALAASRDHITTVEWLLQQGSNINHQNQHGETALHLAIQRQALATARWLLAHGATPNAQNRQGKTGLHVAVERNDPAMVELLLGHRADPTLADHAGNSASQLAQKRQHDATLSVFRKHGLQAATSPAVQQRVTAARQSTDEVSPLQLAVERKDLALAQALLPESPNPWQPNAQGHTVITLAAQQNHPPMLAWLLKQSQGKGMIGPQGRSALFFAVAANRRDNLKLLLANGSDPLQRDSLGKDTITFALEQDSPLATDLLTAVPSSRWQAAWLPLAARQGQHDVTQILIKGGMDLNVQDNKHATALWHAANQGQTQIVEMLLKQDADASLADNSGNTPLHMAASGRQPQIVQALIPGAIRGKQIDRLNLAGNSSLHLAAAAGLNTHVRLLIDAGASKDLRDKNGNTPLMLAVLAHDPTTVKTLLDAGASQTKRNNNSQNAQAIATQLGYQDIATLLQQSEEQSGIMSIFK